MRLHIVVSLGRVRCDFAFLRRFLGFLMDFEDLERDFDLGTGFQVLDVIGFDGERRGLTDLETLFFVLLGF